MIKQQELEQYLGKKTFDNISWEYDSNLVQIIKKNDNLETGKTTYNLKTDNLQNKYDIMIILAKDSFTGYCNCPLGKKGQKCEHVLLGLLKLQENQSNDLKTQQFQNSDKYKLNLLQDFMKHQKEHDELSLVIKIIDVIASEVIVEYYAKINEQQEYKITNVEKLIDQTMRNLPLSYGKKLTTENYQVQEVTSKIFLILNGINNREKINYLQKKTTTQNSLNSLSVLDFEQILNLYNNRYLKYQKEDFLVTDTIKDVPIRIIKNDDTIELYFQQNSSYQLISQNLIINKDQKMIYLIAKEPENKIKLLEALKNHNQNQALALSKKESKEFLQTVLPSIYNEFDVSVDSNLGLEIISERVEIKLKCYLENKQIKIKPVYMYGKYDTSFDYDNILIKRNNYQENKLIKNLLDQGYNYDLVHEEFFIDVEKSQFIFLTKNIFEFKQEYEVDLDDKLKNAILKFDSSTINISIKNNQKYDYFDFDFEIKNIANTEIVAIIKSFEQKKNYHRLENDTFIALNDQKVYEQLIFLRDVIKNNTYKLNTYRIPKYKALLLNEEVKSKFSKVTVNQSFQNYLEEIQLIKSVPSSELESVNYKLRKYQTEGVSWLNSLYEARFGALLADEMGLGKTLQVIAFLEYQKLSSGLIIVPKALLYNWEKEFKKFNPEQKVVIVEGGQEKRAQLISRYQKGTFLIASYNSLQNDYALYENINFPVMIIDEAQYIKNPQTKTSRCVKMIKADFFIALTGTPIENNLLELWSIFDFLLPGYFNDVNSFAKKYNYKESNVTNIDILHRGIAPFILRRLKKEVLKELPDKIEINTFCELETKQAKLYEAMRQKTEQDFQNIIKNQTYNKKNMEILAAITRLRQLAIDPELYVDDYKETAGKMEVFLELIREITEAGEKVLVFSQYSKMLKKLAKKLEQEDQKYYYLDGETRPRQRLIDTEKFNKNKIPIYLISLKAGGVGLNLTGATNVIIYDPWWNPAVENQAIDRSHRLGQTAKVNVYRLITSGTIEEQINLLKNDKQELVEKVLNNNDQEVKAINQMNSQELLGLLKVTEE